MPTCRDQLYCSLTCQVMHAKLETVKKHMTGKRFNAAKSKSYAKYQFIFTVCNTAADTASCHIAEFENDERELMEEPDIETSEEVSTCAYAAHDTCLQFQQLSGIC